MAESPSSNNAPIWVALITVGGSLLSAFIVNGDKWLGRGEKSDPSAGPPAAASLHPGPAVPEASATDTPQTSVQEQTSEANKPAQGDEAAGDPEPAHSAIAPLEADAKDRFRQYFDAWSDPGDPEGSSVGQFYAQRVNFYGKQLSLQEVMGEKQRFARRWPSRSYTIRPSSLHTECSSETRACKVFGTVDWRASSDSRASYSSGTAAFTLLLNRGTIVAENGRVISRN